MLDFPVVFPGVCGYRVFSNNNGCGAILSFFAVRNSDICLTRMCRHGNSAGGGDNRFAGNAMVLIHRPRRRATAYGIA